MVQLLFFIAFSLLSSWNDFPQQEVNQQQSIVTNLHHFEPLAIEEEGVRKEIKWEIPLPELPPTTVDLSVPFFSQAPDGFWGHPWEEACEESSITLAYAYITGQLLTKEQFKTHVLSLVEWQKEHFGDYKDTGVDKTAAMLHANFPGVDAQVVTVKSTEDIKSQLAEGHVIVAPFAGRMLGNPHYSNEGPYYHMLVIKGYNTTHFITHDVGTRFGADFPYEKEKLFNSIYDWAGNDLDWQGEKKILVVKGLK